jgi:hypothetical protein
LYRLHAYTLAAISPDGTAFAMVDSYSAPSVVMMVDADGAQQARATQLSARLQNRHIPFVRVDQCPRRLDHRGKCEAQLAEKLGRTGSAGGELDQLIHDMADQPGVLFVLPSMAVLGRARVEGGSVIRTMLRADFSRKDRDCLNAARHRSARLGYDIGLSVNPRPRACCAMGWRHYLARQG